MFSIPTPKPWANRASAMPWVPGNTEQVLTHIRALLLDIERQPYLDRPFDWPLIGSTTTARQALKSLGSAGLVVRNGPRASLTTEARIFLEGSDDSYLIALFHANVRFVGEAIATLTSPMSQSELNEVANDQYQLPWSTLDQIRRRATWLRATGLVELWRTRNTLVLTDKGREFLTLLDVAQPADLSRMFGSNREAPPLPALSPAISSLMARLDQDALQKRKTAIGYIAGSGVYESIRTLANISSPWISFSDFTAFCGQNFRISARSAKQALTTLRGLGIIHQKALDVDEPTETCSAWMTSDNPIDLVGIVHARVALTAEILSSLSATTPIDTSAIYDWLVKNYPTVTLTRSELTTRLVLLRECELIERVSHLTYRLTPMGEEFRRMVPLQETSPNQSGSSRSTENKTADAQITETRVIADELVSSSTTDDSHRLIDAVGRAFHRMGLAAERTDSSHYPSVLVTFWLSPTKRHRLVIGARSKSSGIVGEDEVLDELKEYRERYRAHRAVLVGPQFGGQLPKWADEKNILLVAAKDLASWLQRFTEVPLNPEQILGLLGSDDGGSTWQKNERHLAVIAHMVKGLWKNSNDPEEVQYNSGVLSQTEIWHSVRKELTPRISEVEAEAALQWLCDPHVAGAHRRGKDEYSAACNPRHLAARMRAIANRLDALDPGPPPPRVQPPHRPVSPDTGVTRVTSTEEIRAWALHRGYSVGSVGRLPKSIVEEFHECQ